MLRKIIVGTAAFILIGFIVIQILPVGNFISVLKRDPNPPVTATVAWDSPLTERMVRNSCFDCHSNETVWPWYSNVAPFSWLITREVNKGRRAMNFSEDPPESFDVDDMEWHINNDMPPRLYLTLHTNAELSQAERALLVKALAAMYGRDGQSGMDGMNMGGS